MKNVQLTENEKEVIFSVYIANKELIGFESISFIETKKLSVVTEIELSSLKGVIGSLVKKGVLETYEVEKDGDFFGQKVNEYNYWVSFKNQEEAKDEEIRALIIDKINKANEMVNKAIEMMKGNDEVVEEFKKQLL